MPASVPRRVGDADRARVADLLGEHYVSGRLDLAEFDQRSTRAMYAVHQHELDALLADLPTINPMPVVTATVRGTPTRTEPRVKAVLLLLLAFGLVVLTQGAALWFLPVLWWVAGGSRHRHHARCHSTRRQVR